jgi:hypothetical protein
MDGLQFSLFFVALLVGYLVIHIRLVRFEQYLREMVGLKTINERLGALASALEKLKLDRLEQRLERLHEDFEDLREDLRQTAATLTEAVVHIPTPSAPAMTLTASAEVPASDRVRALVETRLVQLGYGNLRLLTDLAGVSLDGEVEVQVECEKNHMPCKGRVMLRGGSLRDVQMQPVVQAFP